MIWQKIIQVQIVSQKILQTKIRLEIRHPTKLRTQIITKMQTIAPTNQRVIATINEGHLCHTDVTFRGSDTHLILFF